MSGEVRCYLDRTMGMDAWGLWFYTDTHVARVDGHRLIWEPREQYQEVEPALLLNGREEAPALLAALENTPTANVWKARYEELAAALEVAEARVDRIIDKAIR